MSHGSLAPISASPVTGRCRRRRDLRVSGPEGEPIIDAALGKAAKIADATFETAEGEFRVEASALWTGGSDIAVVDRTGKRVATARDGAVVLGGGETLAWARTGFLRHRYRLGGDLWVARSRWLR